ncbi:GTPase Obg [Mycoplasmopsis agalactiae]|uniref:GTPase ObgE n=1 Tax=Mycoplasmopsis agalactiae TaxID=2110 RepID=UPI000C70C440|nr:GTPase ObgE [Mycoplasmopsis agalactiae]MCE6057243.1 GTPase ObgE [Mycoplasmopsis agalactiae]MCE6079029.1 GTPase ObgE [Mycoplasmopsis agalactiae]MCE6095417.1 GTPase ObgE [Mycoplasmopsis agalactiae]MCE6114671.1 GTPase ObgE [Mycoplasmopsis agalactiae]NLS34487.1 GTPase ObgE [Mycoplasmopsis agalactiae]
MAKFIDEIKLTLIAGKGGDGIISFRREAHVDKGGPDGGDGGKGGNIYFVGDKGKNTLLSLYGNKQISAEDGINGGPKNLYGATGKSTYVKVPIGTMVFKNDKLVADIIEEKEYLVAQGGIGGRGNAKFKSNRNTAPRICENGTPGEKYLAHIVLKVMSDVGIIGKPSAGKSTLLSAISNAKAKIAEYEFTTLVPQLGLVKYHDHSFTVADLPGLIKGASEGKGLGIQFLRHIERCRVVVQIIDFGSEEKNPIEDFEIINKELEEYSKKLASKPKVVVANKSDLQGFKERVNIFKAKYPDVEIVEISAIERQNLEELKGKIWKILEEAKLLPADEEEETEEIVEIKLEDDYKISNPYAGFFEITGPKIEQIYHKIPLVSYDNLIRFNTMLKKIGVWDDLLKYDIKPGDTVRILDYEFEWDGEF